MAVRVFYRPIAGLNRYRGYHHPLIGIYRTKIMLDSSIIGKLILFPIGPALQACIGCLQQLRKDARLLGPCSLPPYLTLNLQRQHDMTEE